LAQQVLQQIRSCGNAGNILCTCSTCTVPGSAPTRIVASMCM
jgi:hypothetical protein